MRPAAIMVLGTAQYDGRPSQQLLGRLKHACDLAGAYPSAQVYTLGGSLPGDRFTEAGVSARYLQDAGIDSARITEVAHGSDTAGSVEALVAKHPVVDSDVLVVTDPNHALRAEKIVRRAGLNAVAAPTPYCPAIFPHQSWWVTLVHESGGLIVNDVLVLAGEPAADRVEAMLRGVEGLARPSRRKRYDHLRAMDNEE